MPDATTPRLMEAVHREGATFIEDSRPPFAAVDLDYDPRHDLRGPQHSVIVKLSGTPPKRPPDRPPADRDDDDDHVPETPPTEPEPEPIKEPPNAPGKRGPYVVD